MKNYTKEAPLAQQVLQLDTLKKSELQNLTQQNYCTELI